MNYTIMNFSTATGTMTVAFEAVAELTTATVALNYVAPRRNGVYLEGAELDDFVCMLAGQPLTGALTQEEIDQMSQEMASDDPAAIAGGQAIRDHHRAYLQAQGTPTALVEFLTNR